MFQEGVSCLLLLLAYFLHLNNIYTLRIDKMGGRPKHVPEEEVSARFFDKIINKRLESKRKVCFD